jgi:hypothetical protein
VPRSLTQLRRRPASARRMFAVQVFAPSEHRATMLQPTPAGVFFRKVHDAVPARARS